MRNVCFQGATKMVQHKGPSGFKETLTAKPVGDCSFSCCP